MGNQYSISKICDGNKVGVMIFGPHSLDDEGNIMPFSMQMSIISHYIQNRGTKFEETFEGKAIGLIDDIYNSDQIKEACGDLLLAESSVQYSLFPEFSSAPFMSVEKPKFTFIDLFAGIGGFRMAMQNLGGKCVFSSEWDSHAQRTYMHNYGEVPFGDITTEQVKSFIPNGFDILCAGFPCQAFSIAGYRRGFEDTRGTLFFDVAEIIKRKRPKAVYLENVKNLQNHDEGRTFATIKQTLEDLGYVVYFKVMNASEYGNIPQNRERIFIVCFDPKQVVNHAEFVFPEREELTKSVQDCIDKNVEDPIYFYTDKMSHYDELVENITESDSIYQWRRQYVRKNQKHLCPTLTANMGTGGHNVPLIKVEKGIRKLTPKECLNFQGYPENFSFPNTIPNSSKYKQAGNSVVVPLIQRVCQNIIAVI